MFVRCKLATVNPDSRRLVGQFDGGKNRMWENKNKTCSVMTSAPRTNPFVRPAVEKQSYTLVAEPPISLRDLGLLHVVWENKIEPCRLMTAPSRTNALVRAAIE